MDDVPFELTDREMLDDLLISQNHIVSLYNRCLCETESVRLRENLLEILCDEHNNLQQIQTALVKRGWGKRCPASSKNVAAMKEIYINLQNTIE